MPYQSPSRCSLGRINWKGVSAMGRVPAGTWGASSARAKGGEQRNTTMTMETRIWDLVLMRICSRFSCGYQNEPFGSWSDWAYSFSPKGEILPQTHWRSPPREFL